MKRSAILRLTALASLAGLLGGGLFPARAPAGAAPEAAFELWRKAVRIFRSNRDWYPERVVIASKVLNGRKRFRSLTEIFVTLQPSGAGRLRVRLDRYLRNGVDKTEEMRPRVMVRNPLLPMAPSEENGYSVSIADSPFDPDLQSEVAYAPRNERRVLAGRSCRRFDFMFRRESGEDGGGRGTTWEGAAWLEEGSGRPVELRFSVTPLPGRVRSAEIVYRYGPESPDRWVVRDAVIEGYGTFLFIKRYFTVTTSFSRYLRTPLDLDPQGPAAD